MAAKRLREWLRNEPWEPYLVLAVCLAGGLVSTGFYVNRASITVGEDDVDCNGTGGRHDETERLLNGCTQFCETHPVWFKWGRDRDCYWDDRNASGPDGGA